MNVNGTQILSCLNDYKIEGSTNETDDAARFLKLENEM